MQRYKSRYSKNDINMIMSNLKTSKQVRSKNKNDKKETKRILLLSAAAIMILSVNIFKGISDNNEYESVIKTVEINNSKYKVNELVNKLESGEIDPNKLSADAYTIVMEAMDAFGGEEAARSYNKKHKKFVGKHMFDKCNKETIEKLKKMDLESDWFNSAELMDPMTLHISEYGAALLKSMEGFIGIAKQLPGEKYYTGGYGHYGPDVKANAVITKEQADEWFDTDIIKFEDALKSICSEWMNSGTFAGLSQDMFDALIMYLYNRGSGPLVSYSNLTKEINSLRTSDYLDCVDMLKFDQGENDKGHSYYSTVDGKKAKIFGGWKKRRALEGELFKGNKYNPCEIVKIPQELKDTGIFEPYPKIDSITLLQHLQQKEYHSSKSSEDDVPEL